MSKNKQQKIIHERDIEEDVRETPKLKKKDPSLIPYLVNESTDKTTTTLLKSKDKNGNEFEFKKISYVEPIPFAECGRLFYDESYNKWSLQVEETSNFDIYSENIKKQYPDLVFNARTIKGKNGKTYHSFTDKGLQTVYYTHFGTFSEKKNRKPDCITRQEAISFIYKQPNFSKISGVINGSYFYNGSVYLDVTLKKVVITSKQDKIDEDTDILE